MKDDIKALLIDSLKLTRDTSLFIKSSVLTCDINTFVLQMKSRYIRVYTKTRYRRPINRIISRFSIRQPLNLRLLPKPMDINEQTDAFCYDVGNVVKRYSDEFDLNHATIVGVLEMIKMEYLLESSAMDVEFEMDDDFWDDDDQDEGYEEAF